MSASTPFCSHYAVALTGGIASGKSAVSKRLAQLGARIVDTDEIAHQLTQPGGEAIPQIQTVFGMNLIDTQGAMDRTAMRNLVFTDARAKTQLEQILHPLIHLKARSLAGMPLAPTEYYAVFVVPLLVSKEGHAGQWRERVQCIINIDCLESTQLTRLCSRPGISQTIASAMIQTQASSEQRNLKADIVLTNEDSLDALLQATDQLHLQLMTKASHWANTILQNTADSIR